MSFKSEEGTPDRHAKKSQGHKGHGKAKERGLRRNRPCPHPDLECPASRTVKRSISVKPSNLLYLATAD